VIDSCAFIRVSFYLTKLVIVVYRQLVGSAQGLLTLAGPLVNDGSSSSKSAVTPGGPKPKRDVDLALLKL